jgi:succinate dehydrogenase / fumarate reductase, cytochrome b subunit
MDQSPAPSAATKEDSMANVSASPGAAVTRRKAPFPVEFYRSAVGKKYVMAITGIMLVGFAFAHMVGNLKMYLGALPEGSKYAYHLDEYGEFLREIGEPIFPRTVVLWILRLGLIGAFALHMHAAFSLTVMNRKARTVSYQSKRDYLAANFASRTMRYSGMIFVLFLVWHLADLTWGVSGIAGSGWERGEVYHNVDASLSRWPVAIFYIVCNLALGTHLFHGAWSFFQSLGVNNPRFNAARKAFAMGIAGVIVAGNVSFPIAVLAGVVGS